MTAEKKLSGYTPVRNPERCISIAQSTKIIERHLNQTMLTIADVQLNGSESKTAEISCCSIIKKSYHFISQLETAKQLKQMH